MVTNKKRTIQSIILLAIAFPTVIKSKQLDSLQEEWLALSHAINTFHDLSDLSHQNFDTNLNLSKVGQMNQGLQH